MYSTFTLADVHLLALLRENARASLTELCQESGMPVSTAFLHLKKLEKSLIEGYTSILDFTLLDMPVHVILAIRVAQERKYDTMALLMRSPYLNSLYRVSGDAQVLAELVFPGMSRLKQLITTVKKQEPERIECYHIKDVGKREGFFCSGDLDVLTPCLPSFRMRVPNKYRRI